MTTNHDLDQAREWAAEITESRQTNIRPEAFAVARVIQSLPDEWIDADKLREALDWRDSKPSGDDYDGEFYDRLRVLLPGPPLPDPLFLAKAKHPEFGEGIVGSYHPDMSGIVRFMLWNSGSVDGTRTHWVPLYTLTFHTPEPEQPQPEDVNSEPQPGEAWLIEYEGKRYEAVYWYSSLYAHWSFVEDREVLETVESYEATPVSRLFPETPKFPETEEGS